MKSRLARRDHIAVLLLTLLMGIPDSKADDSVLGHFTASVSKMYVASEMCQESRPYGAQNYGKLLADYLQLYFTDGLQYWVLPNVTRRIVNARACGSLLAERLLDYESASVAFVENYPEKPKPPYLVADTRITNSNGNSSNIEIELAPTQQQRQGPAPAARQPGLSGGTSQQHYLNP